MLAGLVTYDVVFIAIGKLSGGGDAERMWCLHSNSSIHDVPEASQDEQQIAIDITWLGCFPLFPLHFGN